MNSAKFDVNDFLKKPAQSKEADNHNSRTIRFRRQANGYEREQVDRYIQELSSAYNAMHRKYTKMVQNNAEMDDKAEIMGKALVQAEVEAKQTVEAANQKALRIVEEAKATAQLLSDSASGKRAAIDTIIQIIDDTKTAIDLIFTVVEDTKTKADVAVKIIKGAREKIDFAFQSNHTYCEDIAEAGLVEAPSPEK